MRQLDVHDDQVGHEPPCGVERIAAIGDGFNCKALIPEHVAKQSPVEIVVLDNQDSFCHSPVRHHLAS